MKSTDAGTLVMEYYRKVRKPVTIHALADGTVKKASELPADFDKSQIQDSRTAHVDEIQWFKLNAIEILDQTI
jgi:hypothetical protein